MITSFINMRVLLLLLLAVWLKGSRGDAETAIPCDVSQCQLPQCLCSSTTPPPGVNEVTEYPQIVMLSFDDALVANLYYSFYQPLFKYKNPDQCDIGITFFLAHDYSDYTLVHDVWSRGYEIASHSISHQTPTTYWQELSYQGWVDEMHGLRQIASTLANIPIENIEGARAPFLQIGGDVMAQALYDQHFEYDCSMPSLAYTYPPLFPYTFDYRSTQDCAIMPCPIDSYPGMWEVPLVDFNSTYPCAMLDSCTGITGRQNTSDFLLSNFNRHYTTNRAPIGLFTHASWFLSDPTHFDGYLDFLDYLSSLDDVYIVTVSKAIEWMKSPTKLKDLSKFKPWFCNKPSSTCNPISCHYKESTPGGERYMMSCVPCPLHYPWVGDPYGNGSN